MRTKILLLTEFSDIGYFFTVAIRTIYLQRNPLSRHSNCELCENQTWLLMAQGKKFQMSAMKYEK